MTLLKYSLPGLSMVCALLLGLSGCETDYGYYNQPIGSGPYVAGVPAGASVVYDGGWGRNFYYTAPGPGTVYLYDMDDHHIVHREHVHDGDRFHYDRDRLNFNGHHVGGFHGDHHYRVYYHEHR